MAQNNNKEKTAPGGASNGLSVLTVFTIDNTCTQGVVASVLCETQRSSTCMEESVNSFLLVGLPTAAAVHIRAHDERIWQRQYCEGMELEKHLPSGNRFACLSSEYAIEVEWAKHWAEAVGQSLYYAGATGRKPGIILLCEQSEGPVEGLCRSYVYRLEYALAFVNTHVYVWTCAIDKDVKLDDCFRPEIQPTESNSQVPAH